MNLGNIGRLTRAASEGMGSLSSSMMGLAVVAGFAASFLAFGLAIKWAADQATQLQTSMFSIAVATHVPMAAAMAYTNTLMNLAAGSVYTTAQIADGIVQLGRASYSLQDIMGKTADGMHGMAAAGVALGISTRSTAVEGFKLLAQSMAAYNAPASQAMHYADMLQFAFEHQRGSVADLTAALSQVTPQARQFNVPLREVIAALDTFGPAMASSARAGTSLRYMLTGLYSPTVGAQAEMVKLGLASVDAGGHFHSAFYNNKGAPIDFAAAVHLLATKLKGMNQEAQNDALHKLFSVKGGQGVADMLQMIQKFDGYLKQLSQSSDNAGGAMRRWNEVMKTSAGAQAALKSSITDLGAAIGLALMPVIVAVSDKINQFVSGLRTMVNANPQAAASFLKLGLAISGLGLALGIVALFLIPITAPFMMFIAVVVLVIAFVIALTAAIARLDPQFHILAAASTAVGAAFRFIAGIISTVVTWFHNLMASCSPLATLFMQIRNALAGIPVVGQYLAAVFQALVSTIRQLIPVIGSQFADAWSQVKSSLAMLAPYWPQISSFLRVLAAIIVGLVVAAILIFIALLVAVAHAMAMFLGGMAQAIAGFIIMWTGIISFWRAFFMLIWGLVSGNTKMTAQAFKDMWEAIKTTFVGAVQLLIGLLKATFGTLAALVVGFVNFFIQFFIHLANTIVGGSIWPDMLNAMVRIAVSAFAAIVAAVASFVMAVINFFVQLGAQAIAAVQAAWNFIRSAFSAGVSAVVAVVSSGVASVINWFHNMGSQLISTVNNAWNSAKSAFSAGVNAVVGFAATLPGRVIGAIAGLAGMLYSAGANAMNMFANGLSSAIGAVTSAVNTAAGVVAGFLAHLSPAKMGPLSKDDQWMPNMMKMFASGIEEHTPLLTSAMNRAAWGIASAPSTARLGTPTPSLFGGSQVGGNTTIPLVVDGQVLATVVLNRLTGQMSMNGLGRSFR